MGKMRLKKSKRKLKVKYILYLAIIYIAYSTTFYYLASTNINISNKSFVNAILKEGNHRILYNYPNKEIVEKVVNFFSDLNFNNSNSLVNFSNIISQSNTNNGIISNMVYEDSYETDPSSNRSEYIEDPNPVDIKNPIVYLYNTHQLEKYSYNNLQAYNITPNVMMASYIFREQLNNLGIATIVEQTNITDLLNANGWSYGYSYRASKTLMEVAKKQNETLKYYIDVHRDSVSTTIDINNEKCAKILFVVGMANKNYQSNLEMMQTLHNRINEKYNNLSKGILTKQGTGVNGIYNQDFSPNVILIEIGGIENTIEEVNNTIKLIAPIIAEYIKEKK